MNLPREPLSRRFLPIKAVPLEIRLKHPCKCPQQWLHQMEHQKQVIQSIQQYTGRQLTLMQSFQWGTHC